MPAPALDADTLAWLRSQVGDTPDDDTLADVVDQQAGAGEPDPVRAAARWVLGKRLADFVAAPASLSVAGEITRSTGANITALQAQLATLDVPADAGLPVATVTPLAGRRWRR